MYIDKTIQFYCTFCLSTDIYKYVILLQYLQEKYEQSINPFPGGSSFRTTFMTKKRPNFESLTWPSTTGPVHTAAILWKYDTSIVKKCLQIHQQSNDS